MKKLLLAWTVLLLGAGLVFTAGACGSGGGTTTDGPPSLAGVYCWLFWQGSPGGPDAECHWGSVTGDGTSMIDITNVFQNDNGTVSGPIPSTPLPYTIGAGNTFSTSSGGTTLTGGIAQDSSIAVMSTTSASNPAVLLLGKKGSGFSLASLQGSYHLAAFFENGAGQVSWFNGTVGFDGAGNGTTLDVDVNSNGNISMPAPIPAGTYTVAADGHVVWTSLGGPFEGGLFGGGEVAVLTGSTMNGTNLQFFIVLIRKGAGLSNATFSGSYHSIALFGEDAPPPTYESATFTTAADGAGNITIGAGTINSDGVPMPIPAGGTVPCTVAADGLRGGGCGHDQLRRRAHADSGRRDGPVYRRGGRIPGRGRRRRRWGGLAERALCRAGRRSRDEQRSAALVPRPLARRVGGIQVEVGAHKSGDVLGTRELHDVVQT